MADFEVQKKKISRRSFIKTAGVALGAGVVACGGLSYFGLKTPSVVEFPEGSFGPGIRPILVAYASKCGATAETAEFIGRQLAGLGQSVEWMPARRVQSLEGYGAVILGSACYMGSLLAEAREFAEKHLASASNIPVAFFSVGLTAKDKTPEKIQEALAYFGPLRAVITPAAEAAFPGRIAYDTLPFLYRTMAQADKAGALAEGDYRDWDAVTAWVDALPAGFYAK
jgi:Flavodoxin